MRLFLRPLTVAVAASACCAGLVAGCAGAAPAPPTAAQLLASAATALRGGQPCSVNGDVIIGPTDGANDSVSSVSAGDQFSATITQHLPGAKPLAVPQRLLDDGAALYFQSAEELRLNYESTMPARLARSWIRFPSWPALSHHAYDAYFSTVSQYPGQGGQALLYVMMDSVNAIYQGRSCGLLLTKLRYLPELVGRVMSGKLEGRPVFTFTLAHVFVPLSSVQYRITVSRGTPVRLLRVTSGSDVLTLSYPATIAPISAPLAAEVIAPTQLLRQLGGR